MLFLDLNVFNFIFQNSFPFLFLLWTSYFVFSFCTFGCYDVFLFNSCAFLLFNFKFSLYLCFCLLNVSSGWDGMGLLDCFCICSNFFEFFQYLKPHRRTLNFSNIWNPKSTYSQLLVWYAIKALRTKVTILGSSLSQPPGK